jgi:DNA integrity scanning protein DisA with diadenylate cyclase activity
MSKPASDQQENLAQPTTSNTTTQSRLTRSTIRPQTSTDQQLTDEDLQDVIQTANTQIQKLEKSKKTYDKKKDHLTLLKLDEISFVIAFWTKLQYPPS